MGKGNVCVSGPYEGLFYIDSDYTTVLRREDDCEDTILQKGLSAKDLSGNGWLFDDEGSANELEDVLECFVENFTHRYPSFARVEQDKWLGRNVRVILESSLFYIGIEDSDWAYAVELLQKDNPCSEGFQRKHYKAYLDGMKAALLERLPSIGTYTGPWTHGTIRREPVKDNDFLAEAGDRIDNAVFDFICAVVTGHSVNGEAPKEALLAAVNELSVEHVNALPEGLLSDATNEAKETAGEHSLQEDAGIWPPLVLWPTIWKPRFPHGSASIPATPGRMIPSASATRQTSAARTAPTKFDEKAPPVMDGAFSLQFSGSPVLRFLEGECGNFHFRRYAETIPKKYHKQKRKFSQRPRGCWLLYIT